MNIIIVGLGGRGRSWIEVSGQNTEVSIVAFVEPVEEIAQSAAERYSIPDSQLFTSLSAAANEVNADAVLDVTPPAVHERIALEAFDHGLHVLGEKPLSDNFEAAKRIVAAAERANKTHMVTQNYRFGSLPRTTRRVLEEQIGSPAVTTVGFYRAWATRAGTHYTTMPYPLITDMGIHHFDLLRYVLDREPLRVRAQTWNPPWGWHAGDAGHTAIFEFEDGLIATHHALGCSVGKQSPWNGDWRIEGENGSLTWEEDRLYFTCAHPHDISAREEIPLDELPLSGQNALLAEFVSSIKENREPECSGRDNLNSLAMVFAAIRSAKEDRTVEIAEDLKDWIQPDGNMARP